MVKVFLAALFMPNVSHGRVQVLPIVLEFNAYLLQLYNICCIPACSRWNLAGFVTGPVVSHGSGQVSGELDPTRPVRFENLVIRPDPTRPDP